MSRSIKIIFSVWIIIWISFTLRPLFKEGYLKQYLSLIGKSLEERRAYIYGEDLYKFLNYCLKNLPIPSTYRLVGVKSDSIDYVRAIYYLYPHLKTEEHQFILVYGIYDFKQPGYSIFSSMNQRNFILRRE